MTNSIHENYPVDIRVKKKTCTCILGISVTLQRNKSEKNRAKLALNFFSTATPLLLQIFHFIASGLAVVVILLYHESGLEKVFFFKYIF